jgi:hypothetical protein
MRIFATAAAGPLDTAPRTAVPVEILRRLAFGRPQRRTIQPALPVQAAEPAAQQQLPVPCDLDQRVRESGEW